MQTSFDAIVIGGGAAGLFCAAEAGKRGRNVLLLEHGRETGRKILISGGGRCNFTNAGTTAANFLSANPHFAKSALARYSAADFTTLVDKHRIPWHEKKLGQLFCDRSARDMVGLLHRECQDGGVRLVMSCQVTAIRKDAEFTVESSCGSFTAPALVIATGGLSIPKIGATGFGYDVARHFGLAIEPPRPALVPLVLNPDDCSRWCDLAGVAAECEARFAQASFRERLLITHRGLSGPAVLQVSSYWDGRSPITFDLLPEEAPLPRRLASRFAELYPDPESLATWQLTPAGTEGYTKAEVTAGGVSTLELSSKTMESRKVPGLFFIGEVVDVTGHLGGYNFQWAWSSAWAAGQAL
ncbi:MAG TPA: NAD(P)/FAD-dependent oxidoreductase [Bryobacteraceae bacterium]|nr:NAD(P)/FAD-dependent oxidoreductase [Bryobacteraceae bacterium]